MTVKWQKVSIYYIWMMGMLVFEKKNLKNNKGIMSMDV